MDFEVLYDLGPTLFSSFISIHFLHTFDPPFIIIIVILVIPHNFRSSNMLFSPHTF